MYEKYEKIRDEKGETNYSVAKATGISPVTLSDWKRGVYTPKVDKLMKIAEYLEVPVTDLLVDAAVSKGGK